jgi:hypothetical protein
VTKFLKEDGLELIVRGHQVANEGYEYPFEPHRSVVTVFSATCSPEEFKNKRCSMTIENGTQKFIILPIETTPGEPELIDCTGKQTWQIVLSTAKTCAERRKPLSEIVRVFATSM